MAVAAKKLWPALDEEFRKVSDKSRRIDPGDELDWYSLVVGWALAKGLGPQQAQDYACHVRYHTDMG